MWGEPGNEATCHVSVYISLGSFPDSTVPIPRPLISHNVMHDIRLAYRKHEMTIISQVNAWKHGQNLDSQQLLKRVLRAFLWFGGGGGEEQVQVVWQLDHCFSDLQLLPSGVTDTPAGQ